MQNFCCIEIYNLVVMNLVALPALHCERCSLQPSWQTIPSSISISNSCVGVVDTRCIYAMRILAFLALLAIILVNDKSNVARPAIVSNATVFSVLANINTRMKTFYQSSKQLLSSFYFYFHDIMRISLAQWINTNLCFYSIFEILFE